MMKSPSASDSSLLRNFSRYIREVGKFPILEAEQERMLALRWREHQDRSALEALATSHLSLIVKIAFGFRGYGLPMPELVSEGNVGLLQALARFDPDRGARLATYATWWIRASILEYVVRSSSMVRLCTTPAHRRLFFKLRRMKEIVGARGEGDMPPDLVTRIAQELRVTETDVIIMNQRLAGPDVSLNAPMAGEEDGDWQDVLVDPAPCVESSLADQQELKVRRVLLEQAMTHLDDRERHILTLRRLRDRPSKLDELAAHYGVSRERIRQIEDRAVKKLQQRVNPAQHAVEPIRSPARPFPRRGEHSVQPAYPRATAAAPAA